MMAFWIQPILCPVPIPDSALKFAMDLQNIHLCSKKFLKTKHSECIRSSQSIWGLQAMIDLRYKVK